jgi:hypothetical protein
MRLELQATNLQAQTERCKETRMLERGIEPLGSALDLPGERMPNGLPIIFSRAIAIEKHLGIEKEIAA